MMRPKTLLLVPLLCAALLASACNSNNPFLAQPTATGPATQITDNFPGTLTVNGGVTFPFSVQQTGTITATLTALSPDSSVTVGLLMGTWNGTSCAVSIVNDAATVNATVTGNATGTGNFCVRVYDVGKLSAPTDFNVSIVHY